MIIYVIAIFLKNDVELSIRVVSCGTSKAKKHVLKHFFSAHAGQFLQKMILIIVDEIKGCAMNV